MPPHCAVDVAKAQQHEPKGPAAAQGACDSRLRPVCAPATSRPPVVAAIGGWVAVRRNEQGSLAGAGCLCCPGFVGCRAIPKGPWAGAVLAVCDTCDVLQRERTDRTDLRVVCAWCGCHRPGVGGGGAHQSAHTRRSLACVRPGHLLGVRQACWGHTIDTQATPACLLATSCVVCDSPSAAVGSPQDPGAQVAGPA